MFGYENSETEQLKQLPNWKQNSPENKLNFLPLSHQKHRWLPNMPDMCWRNWMYGCTTNADRSGFSMKYWTRLTNPMETKMHARRQIILPICTHPWNRFPSGQLWDLQCCDEAIYPNELQGIAKHANPSSRILNMRAMALKRPSVPVRSSSTGSRHRSKPCLSCRWIQELCTRKWATTFVWYGNCMLWTNLKITYLSSQGQVLGF